jgi:hypothetical protein
LQDFWMGSSEPMIPIEETIELRWTQMKVYFPQARAKKLIPVKARNVGTTQNLVAFVGKKFLCDSTGVRKPGLGRRICARGFSRRAGNFMPR